MESKVIVALDFQDAKQVDEFLNQFDQPIFVKVGMELYYSEGPTIIKKIKEKNHKIFLDLKIHDIPNTAKQAMKSLKKLDVDIVNVHCAGGLKMMKAAQEVFQDSNTLVIGVTQLTSTSQEILEDELLIKKDINDVILSYAKLAYEAKLDGVVCSPLEAKLIHDNISEDFLTITPGIRYESNDDQVRVTTPLKARELGCDYIVVGRPITKVENSKAMYEKISKEFGGY